MRVDQEGFIQEYEDLVVFNLCSVPGGYIHLFPQNQAKGKLEERPCQRLTRDFDSRLHGQPSLSTPSTSWLESGTTINDGNKDWTWIIIRFPFILIKDFFGFILILSLYLLQFLSLSFSSFHWLFLDIILQALEEWYINLSTKYSFFFWTSFHSLSSLSFSFCVLYIFCLSTVSHGTHH